MLLTPIRWVLTVCFRLIVFMGLFGIHLVNVSPAFSQEFHEIYGSTSPFLDLVDTLNQSQLEIQNPSPNNQTSQIPGFLSYKQSLGSNRHAFFEFSGALDEEDPTDNFTSYLLDPVNWDPSGEIERNFTYGSNLGLTHSGRILEGASTIRMGLQSRLENVQIRYLSSQGGAYLTPVQPLDLLNVTYAPYLTFDTTPFSWVKLMGDVRVDVMHSNVQSVCRTFCSVESNGPMNEIVPSVKGSLVLNPWSNTELFLNVGTGYYSHEGREFAGSIAGEQLSGSTAYEIGFRTRAADRVEFKASLWSVDFDSNLVFLGDGESFVEGRATRRYGTTLDSRFTMLDWVTISGGLSFLQSEFRQTGSPVPHSPNVTSYASLDSQWGHGWTSSFSMRHIGRRSVGVTELSSLPSMTTFDLTTHYHVPIPSAEGRLDVLFGFLNLTNTTRPYTQFSFNTQLGIDQSPIIDLNHFPGQPRMAVAGLSWSY